MLAKRTLTSAFVLAALLACGCTATQEGQKAREDADRIAKGAEQAEREAREAARKALDQRMIELQHRIDALKADAKPASARAKRDLDQRVQELQAEVTELRAKLSTEEGRKDAWARFQTSTEGALGKIEAKIQELRKNQE